MGLGLRCAPIRDWKRNAADVERKGATNVKADFGKKNCTPEARTRRRILSYKNQKYHYTPNWGRVRKYNTLKINNVRAKRHEIIVKNRDVNLALWR